jgi:hypothetical protein
MRRLRVDSGEAFTIANRLASESKIGFDAIDYELSPSPTGNAPIWVMHLRDGQGRDVGEVEVSGEDGKVLRRSWFQPRVADRQPIGPDPSPERRAVRSFDSNGNPIAATGSRIWGRTSTGVGNASVKVKEGFQKIGEGVGKIFRGDATHEVRNEERHRTPKSLRRSRP